MKVKIFALIFGGFLLWCLSARANTTPINPTQIKIIGSPTNVVIRWVTSGKTSAITAKLIKYDFVPKPKTGFAACISPIEMLEIHDPSTGKICFVDADHSFYMSGRSGLKGFTVGPGVLLWSGSCAETPAQAGDDFALAQFERNFSADKFNQEFSTRLTNRINLSQAASRFYFSDAPAAGGGVVMPAVEAVSLTKNILRLDIRNPSTKVPASFWIDFKAGKVIRSVVNDKEMDLSSSKTSIPYALPSKEN